MVKMNQSTLESRDTYTESKEGVGQSRETEELDLQRTHDVIARERMFTVEEESIREARNKISYAVKSNYLLSLNKASGRVKELIHNQEVLRESIQQEMTNLDEYKLTEDISGFVAELKDYHLKLKSMKRDIQYITDRVSKMKRRAAKLRANKEKEEKQVEENKRKQLEIQQQLTAKPAPEAESLDS